MNLLDLRLFGKPPTDRRLSLNKLCKSAFWKFGEIEVVIYDRDYSRFGVAVNIESVELSYNQYGTAKDAITSAERTIKDLKESVDEAMQ